MELLYNLYNESTGMFELIEVTSSEIAEYLGTSLSYINRAARNNILMRGKYRIMVAREKENPINSEAADSWDSLVAWVKKGLKNNKAKTIYLVPERRR